MVFARVMATYKGLQFFRGHSVECNCQKYYLKMHLTEQSLPKRPLTTTVNWCTCRIHCVAVISHS